MKRITEILTAGCRVAVPFAVMAMLGSCSMLHDDLPDCATRPNTRAPVKFVYDYNIDDEDRFADNIGAVTLYVFDSDGHLVRQIESTASGSQLKQPGFSIDLDLPTGTYKLYAAARENVDGYEASLQTSGAKFRRSAFSSGEPLENVFYTLDNQNGTVDSRDEMEHFWLTRTPQTMTIVEAPMPAEGDPQPADVLVEATVPLQRVTNVIHGDIVSGEDRTRAAPPVSPADYDVWVATADGRDKLDLAGVPTADSRALTYPAENVSVSTTSAGDPCISASFSTSRLFHREDTAKNDRLYVKSHKSGETFEFDLPEYLSKGREAYPATGWSKQEYLDREYNYNFMVEFNELDTGWRYIQISIGILSWSKRIQNEQL